MRARRSCLTVPATSESAGALLHDGEMVDEASRKMAERVVARGRAAGTTQR